MTSGVRIIGVADMTRQFRLESNLSSSVIREIRVAQCHRRIHNNRESGKSEPKALA